MLDGDGVLPSGAALASDDSFAPMVKLGRAASSFPGNFYEAEGTALAQISSERTELAPVTH